jgi:hypothetical protein
MDNTELSQGIAKGDATALAYAKELLAGSPSGEHVAAMWKGTIGAIVSGNTPAAKAVNDGLKRLDCYLEAQDLHANLISALYSPKDKHAYIRVTSIAAAVARMNSGKAIDGVDKEFYSKAAGLAFIEVLRKGNDISRRFAAEVAINVDSSDVLAALSEAAQNDTDPRVRNAASGACERYRNSKELKTAQDDRTHLLGKYTPQMLEGDDGITTHEPSSPQTLFIDMAYTAVETILKLKKGDLEGIVIRSSVLQLASFTKMTEQLGEHFSTPQDQENLDTMRWSVENALLHALRTGSQSLKQDAVDGLERIGEDRVELVLRDIILRELPGSHTSLAALETQARIAARKLSIPQVLPHLKPAHARPAVVLAKQKLTRQ